MVYVVLNMFSIRLLKRACITEFLWFCFVFPQHLNLFSPLLATEVTPAGCHTHRNFPHIKSPVAIGSFYVADQQGHAFRCRSLSISGFLHSIKTPAQATRPLSLSSLAAAGSWVRHVNRKYVEIMMLCTTALPWLTHLDPSRLVSGIQEQHDHVQEDNKYFYWCGGLPFEFLQWFFFFSSSVMITAFIWSANEMKLTQ